MSLMSLTKPSDRAFRRGGTVTCIKCCQHTKRGEELHPDCHITEVTGDLRKEGAGAVVAVGIQLVSPRYFFKRKESRGRPPQRLVLECSWWVYL